MAPISWVEGYVMKKVLAFSVLFLSVALVLPVSPSGRPGGQRIPPPAQAAQASGQAQRPALSADLNFGRLPLYFIANRGQMDERVAFYVRGKDKAVYFTPEGLTIVLNGRSERWVLKLDFVGANQDVKPAGEEKMEGMVSYFTGRPQDWVTGLTTYSRVVYPDLWPGIDLVYSGTFDQLKYEFVVHPGADPGQIRLAYRGAQKVTVTEEGRLKVQTPLGSFGDDIPAAYQCVGGKRVEVPMDYQLEKSGKAVDAASPGGEEYAGLIHSYGFHVGEYDRAQPLILDPAIIVYCGYIGGSGEDGGYGLAVDAAGNVYIAGDTPSTETSFPETVGPDLSHNGGSDAFVAKVNSTGTALVYCGFIGGAGDDYGNAIAVDSSGAAYVTGVTTSSQATFPVAVGPDLTYAGGFYDAYIAKVNAAGTALAYCGYIGGTGDDETFGVAVDVSGNAYIPGLTDSTEASFPVTGGPDLTHNGNYDGFIAKVNPSGSAFVYLGYIGGSGYDSLNNVYADGTGAVYMAGVTQSTETTFPVTVGPDLAANGNYDAFVAKLNAAGTSYAYCGFIGGSDNESAYDIDVDGSGCAYICGYTRSTQASFPVSGGPDLTHNGDRDAFVSKVNSSGTGLSFCGYIGGSGVDWGRDVAVDGAGNVYHCGWTNSTETTFPVLMGPDKTHNGGNDAFIAKILPGGLGLEFCGYIGGSGDDFCNRIGRDQAGNIYIAGSTFSTETTLPVAVGPDLTANGGMEGFVAKLKDEALWDPKHAAGDFDGDGADEAAVDFGTMGIYLYDGGIWTQLSAANPESLVAADVDGDNVDELLADLGTGGLWLWNAGAWNQVSGVNVEGMAAGDVDADGADEVAGDFGAVGMWLYNGGAWSQLSGVNADFIAIANLDGSGGAEIVGDFGATGLWIWNTGAWTQLSGVNADYMAFGNMDGSGGEELIGDFGMTGLWLWSQGSGWTQLSGVNADYMGGVQADGDAADEFVGDFGAVGLWLWNGGIWDQLSGADAEFMIAADSDGNGRDEGGVDFGALGLWLWDFSSGWTQLSGVNPEYMMAGDFDGDNCDEIMADFGTIGLWLWNGGAWSQISASNPE